MEETKEDATEALRKTLLTTELSTEIPETEDVYGWLIGSWEFDVPHYAGLDTTQLGLKGEIHFSRALEGRAVQDVWIMPRKADRSANLGKTNNMYGTTLRVWDPSVRGWRITWINPVTGRRDEQIGRWCGKDIVQIGARLDGTPTRWMYTEITPDSFHWTGEALMPDGMTWKLESEFRARRVR